MLQSQSTCSICLFSSSSVQENQLFLVHALSSLRITNPCLIRKTKNITDNILTFNVSHLLLFRHQTPCLMEKQLIKFPNSEFPFTTRTFSHLPVSLSFHVFPPKFESWCWSLVHGERWFLFVVNKWNKECTEFLSFFNHSHPDDCNEQTLSLSLLTLHRSSRTTTGSQRWTWGNNRRRREVWSSSRAAESHFWPLRQEASEAAGGADRANIRGRARRRTDKPASIRTKQRERKNCFWTNVSRKRLSRKTHFSLSVH